MQVRLRVLNGSSAGKELKVNFDEFLVGRSDDCQLRPKSDSISRRHCVIRIRDDQVFVEDLGSRNGTYVNGERIAAETEVHHDDLLRIGKLEFQFSVERPSQVPASPVPVPQEVEGDSWADDDDITKWLQTEDAAGLAARRGDTRQFRFDETERVALETVIKPASDTEAPSTKSEPAPAAAAAEEEKDKEKVVAEKKQPGKLPVRHAAGTTNSREAAADMLKRFFNRP